MTGIHCLQHVDHLIAAGLAHDDPVGAHPQGIPQTIPLGDGAFAFDIRGPAFHPADMRLLQLQLGGVFDGDDPLPLANKGRKRVHQRGFPRSRAARDHDIQPAGDGGTQVYGHLIAHGAEKGQLFKAQLVFAELADRNQRAAQRDRRDDRIEPRPVRQTGIDIGRRFVEPPARHADNLLQDAPQMRLILELHIGDLEQTTLFYENLFRPIDQNVGNRLIIDQDLKRAKAHHLIIEVFDQPIPFRAADGHTLRWNQRFEDRSDLGLNIGLRGLHQRGKVQDFQQLLMCLLPDFSKLPAPLPGCRNVSRGDGLGFGRPWQGKILCGDRRGLAEFALAEFVEHQAVPVSFR